METNPYREKRQSWRRRNDMSKKSIVGHSHVQNPIKGGYAVGTMVTMPNPCAQWYPALDNVPKSLLETMADSMFGEGEMCGHCKLTLLAESHDPNKHARWKCQMCQTDWMGIEPGNDRRGAIMAQRRKAKC